MQTSYNVRDGSQLYMFHDNWMNSQPISEVIGDSIHMWGENLTVNRWLNANSGWNIPRSFCRRFPGLVADMTRRNLTEGADSVVWKLNGAGRYTVKSMYQICRNNAVKVHWDRMVWSSKVPHRYQFCHWLLWKESLKTKVLLDRKSVV